MLLANFFKSSLHIFQYDICKDQVIETVSLLLAEVNDYYNLILKQSLLMLTRQGNDGKFQIIWPEKVEFDIDETEVFVFRKDSQLYFCRWYEDPDYREEIVVISIDELTTEHIKEIDNAVIWNSPDKRYPERASFYCLTITR